MKHQIVTTGIVLARTDYGEADRILTILTFDQGKVRVMAKGVRKARSKLAGGIELFSVSELTLLPARGELHTLVSSRLVTHYGTIVKDIKRTMYGYELLKRIQRVTEDAAGEEYAQLLRTSLEGLDDPSLDLDLLELWGVLRLLAITGHTPLLQEDAAGHPFELGKNYTFDYERMSFQQQPDGPFGERHIKLMRVANAAAAPGVLKPIKDASSYLGPVLNLATHMMKYHLRI